MIVRDEVERLPMCLSSVKGLVQEVWIVDTGSTDGTPELAREMGANVVHYPWEHDFSAARNVGLEKATTEWILIMDADEALAREDASLLLSTLRSNTAKTAVAYFLPIHSFLGDGDAPGKEISYNIRLFRNRPRHRYEGAVHEQILPAIQNSSPDLQIVELPVKILHYGYLEHIVKDKQKPMRNLQIIEKLLEETPDDHHLQYHAGVCLYNLGKWEEAVDYLSQVLESAPRNLNYVARSLKILVIVLRRLGRRSEALAALDKYQGSWPGYTDLEYLRAQLYHDQEDLCRALDAALTCRMQGPAPPPYDSHEGVGTHSAAKLIGDIGLKLGNTALAENAYSEVPVESHGYLQTSALWLRLVAERLGRRAAIMELLRRMPRPYDYSLLAEICASAGFPYVALEVLGTESGISPSAKLLLRGRLLHKLGQLQQALEALLQIEPSKPEWSQSCLWQAYCALGLNSADILVSVASTWGVLHPENRRLLDIIHCLTGGEAPSEPALGLLGPLLRCAAPHVSLAALERALSLVGDGSNAIGLELATIFYRSYHHPELAWQAYEKKTAGVRDPWLEAELHQVLGRPLQALRSSLAVLTSPTRVLPEDYVRAVRASLALTEQFSFKEVTSC